jgi:hypothetical protein
MFIEVIFLYLLFVAVEILPMRVTFELVSMYMKAHAKELTIKNHTKEYVRAPDRCKFSFFPYHLNFQFEIFPMKK